MFTGRSYDFECGPYRYRNRDCNPSLGRFMPPNRSVPPVASISTNTPLDFDGDSAMLRALLGVTASEPAVSTQA